jgi:hypothetical protein
LRRNGARRAGGRSVEKASLGSTKYNDHDIEDHFEGLTKKPQAFSLCGYRVQ